MILQILKCEIKPHEILPSVVLLKNIFPANACVHIFTMKTSNKGSQCTSVFFLGTVIWTMQWWQWPPWRLDTGHLFSYKPGPMHGFLRHTLRSRIQNMNLFWEPQLFLRASEAGKKQQPQLHHFLDKKWNKFGFLTLKYALKN